MNAPPRLLRNDLIKSGIPLVKGIAARYTRRSKIRRSFAEDIYSAGLEGLVRAAIRFDPARDVTFRTFAEKRISGAILDYLRTEDHLTRHFRAQAKETGISAWQAPLRIDAPANFMVEDDAEFLSSGMQIQDHAAIDPFEYAARREITRKIERATSQLPPRTMRALILRYRDDMNLKEIGKVLGYNESRACQILGKAHTVIRDALAA